MPDNVIKIASNFDEAIKVVLDHEGGYVFNKRDPGGATKFGISFYWLKSIGNLDIADVNHDGRISIEDIQALTVEKACSFYKQFWWDFYHYEQINNLAIATKILDTSVNIGGIQTHKIAQRTLTFLGYPCMDDGKFGPATQVAINGVNPTQFLNQFRARQAQYYNFIAQKYNKYEFLKGWLNRAIS